MKKIRWDHPRLRPFKSLLCVIGCLISLVMIYIVLGCPTLSFQQEFRRAEKAHLVGPSKIVDTVEYGYNDFDEMIVGETEHGVCFFGKYYANIPKRSPNEQPKYRFHYWEKTGDLTVVAPPNPLGRLWDALGGASLPVYLFAEYPQAAWAELEMTIKGTDKSSINGVEITRDFSVNFQSTAACLESGVFRFWLGGIKEEECLALCLFSDIVSGNRYLSDVEKQTVIPVTIRLYDDQDQLILEKTVDIRY